MEEQHPERRNAQDIHSYTGAGTQDRSEKVRNFKVHIEDEDSFFGDASYTKDQPVYKGEIYFSNHARRSPTGTAQPQQSVQQPINRRPAPQQAQRSAAQTTAQKPTAAKGKKKKKKKKGGYLGATAKVLISVFLCTAILSGIGISTVNDILAINRSAEPVAVDIKENSTTDEIIDALHDKDLIKRPMICKLFYRLESKMRKAGTPEYVSGMVSLKASMGLEGMLNRVKQNQQLTETVTLYFPEGWTAEQIFEKLEKYEVCEADFLRKSITDVNFNFDFLSSAKATNSPKRYLLLEGYLFPDTYEFFVDNNASSVLQRFLERFDEIWTDKYQERAEEMNMTVDEVIRLASIIQREAANTEQMASISSVLHNRLNNKVSFQTLDCDSTYNYVDNYVTPIVKTDMFRQYYNTYICEGLPAGAICNPGEDAIHAALYPDDTDYCYFQHDKNGKIYLARTNAEHNRYRAEIAAKNAS